MHNQIHISISQQVLILLAVLLIVIDHGSSLDLKPAAKLYIASENAPNSELVQFDAQEIRNSTKINSPLKARELHPLLTWRRQITARILVIFKRSCSSTWVDPLFLNLVIDLYFLELNATVIPLELNTLGIAKLKNSRNRTGSAATASSRVYEQIPMPSTWALIDNILEICAWNCYDRLRIRPSRDKPAKFIITKPSGVAKQVPDSDSLKELANDLNPVFESIWLMFSTTFGICVGDTDAKFIENRLNQFLVGLEQFFFPVAISKKWFRRSTDSQTTHQYGELLSGFNVTGTLANMSICESAAYAIKDLNPNWKPTRPFQYSDFKHVPVSRFF